MISSVPDAEGQEDSPWFVFNDFVVRNVTEEEALSFPDKWKVRNPPCQVHAHLIVHTGANHCISRANRYLRNP
jgi:hypothetical protein